MPQNPPQGTNKTAKTDTVTDTATATGVARDPREVLGYVKWGAWVAVLLVLAAVSRSIRR